MNASVLTTVGFAAIALTAGALVSYQAGANATLGRAIGHPLWATVVSLTVSLLIAIPVMIALRVSVPTVGQAATQLPAWAWLGGIAGVIYVTSALLLTPRMGATNFIICVVAGQILASLLIDHFGLVGLPVREVNLGRVAGAALIFIGMLLVQWFTPRG